MFVESATETQRADAFIDTLITPALQDQRLPTCGGDQPHISVLVPLDRLEHPNTPINADVVAERIRSGRMSRGEGSARIATSNGPGQSLLATQAVQRMTCDAIINRIVINTDNVPTNIGRKSRTIPAHTRKALVHRDGGCIFPSCDRPPGWAEAHHIQHWSAGGQTALTNLALLCSRHHHQIHADNLTIEFDQRQTPRQTPAPIPNLKLVGEICRLTCPRREPGEDPDKSGSSPSLHPAGVTYAA